LRQSGADDAVSPSAVRGGYGVQWQLVPRGTESPSATKDDVSGAVAVVVEEPLPEDDRDDEQPLAMQHSATRPASAHPSRRMPIAQF
jgi:hypothetical protein